MSSLTGLVGFGWLMWIVPVWLDLVILLALGVAGGFLGGWIVRAYWSHPASFLGQWRLRQRLHRLGLRPGRGQVNEINSPKRTQSDPQTLSSNERE